MTKTPPKVAFLGVLLSAAALAWGGWSSNPADAAMPETEIQESIWVDFGLAKTMESAARADGKLTEKPC